MHTSPQGRGYIERKEGLRLHAYQDIAGIWTIGYGHTAPDIYAGVSITLTEADALMASDLAVRFEPVVNKVCNRVLTSQGQFDAMVSLAYNIGAAAFARSSIAKFHRAGQYDKAADAFELYDHVNGIVNDALHDRRVEEGQAYLDASPEGS